MLKGLCCCCGGGPAPHESLCPAFATGGLDLPGLLLEGESGTAGGWGAFTGGAVSSSVSDSGLMYGSS